jgi:hypothetical protein
MANKNMTASEIQNQLVENVGETGNAKVEDGGLYIQCEENTDWQFYGSVEDVDDAKRVVNEFFNQ